MRDLIERLRKRGITFCSGSASYVPGGKTTSASETRFISDPLCAEAADALDTARWLANKREPGRGPADKTKSRHRREHAFAALMVEADAQRARIAEMEAALLRLSEVTPERLNVSSAVVALNAVRAIAATALNPGAPK